MEHKRLTLDNPVFAGTLRYSNRSVAYERRAMQPATISDIAAVRAPKPKPKHVVTAATSLHAPRSKPAPVRHRPARESRAITPKHRRYLSDRRSAVLYTMALVVFAAGLFVAMNGQQANHQVAAQVKHLQKTDTSSIGDGSTPPAATPPPPARVSSYVVAPNLPKYIDIPKLGVHARVLSVGTTKTGALQVPNSIYDTAWYNASSQPGQPGAMLIDGHSGIGVTHGVFHYLPKLVAGDTINVTRGDDQVFTYVVAEVQVVDVQNVDMASMMKSADPAKPGLNLITCAGDWIPGTTELTARALVHAVLQ